MNTETMKGLRHRILAGALLLGSACFAHSADPPPATQHADVEFARVNGTSIFFSDYMMALREQAKKRFYHSRPAEQQVDAFRHEVAEHLIDRALLLQEAETRNVNVDAKVIEEKLNQLKSRYGGAAAVEAAAGEPAADDKQLAFWAALEQKMVEEERLSKLRTEVEAAVSVTDEEVRRYFSENPDKFTEPPRQRVHMILLRVDPSAGNATWEAAADEAKLLSSKIGQGESFAALASLHSSDASAANGGDLGFQHIGVYREQLQDILDGLAINQVSEPTRMLEGYALFKVSERQPARHHKLETVSERAQALCLREARSRSWQQLVARLRDNAEIEIHEEYMSRVDLVSR